MLSHTPSQLTGGTPAHSMHAGPLHLPQSTSQPPAVSSAAHTPSPQTAALWELPQPRAAVSSSKHANARESPRAPSRVCLVPNRAILRLQYAFQCVVMQEAHRSRATRRVRAVAQVHGAGSWMHSRRAQTSFPESPFTSASKKFVYLMSTRAHGPACRRRQPSPWSEAISTSRSPGRWETLQASSSETRMPRRPRPATPRGGERLGCPQARGRAPPAPSAAVACRDFSRPMSQRPTPSHGAWGAV